MAALLKPKKKMIKRSQPAQPAQQQSGTLGGGTKGGLKPQKPLQTLGGAKAQPEAMKSKQQKGISSQPAQMKPVQKPAQKPAQKPVQKPVQDVRAAKNMGAGAARPEMQKGATPAKKEKTGPFQFKPKKKTRLSKSRTDDAAMRDDAMDEFTAHRDPRAGMKKQDGFASTFGFGPRSGGKGDPRKAAPVSHDDLGGRVDAIETEPPPPGYQAPESADEAFGDAWSFFEQGPAQSDAFQNLWDVHTDTAATDAAHDERYQQMLADHDAMLDDRLGQTYADEALAGRRAAAINAGMGRGMGGGMAGMMAQTALGGMQARQGVMSEHDRERLNMQSGELARRFEQAMGREDRGVGIMEGETQRDYKTRMEQYQTGIDMQMGMWESELNEAIRQGDHERTKELQQMIEDGMNYRNYVNAALNMGPDALENIDPSTFAPDAYFGGEDGEGGGQGGRGVPDREPLDLDRLKNDAGLQLALATGNFGSGQLKQHLQDSGFDLNDPAFEEYIRQVYANTPDPEGYTQRALSALR